jgi:hypothetical protein
MTQFMLYGTVRQVAGADVQPGMWLDTPDRQGARKVYGIMIPFDPEADQNERTVIFGQYASGGYDSETLRADEFYDVVDSSTEHLHDGDQILLTVVMDWGDFFIAREDHPFDAAVESEPAGDWHELNDGATSVADTDYFNASDETGRLYCRHGYWYDRGLYPDAGRL